MPAEGGSCDRRGNGGFTASAVRLCLVEVLSRRSSHLQHPPYPPSRRAAGAPPPHRHLSQSPPNQKESIKRADALLKANADALVVDIAHGHSNLALNTVKKLRTEFGDDIEITGVVIAKLDSKGNYNETEYIIEDLPESRRKFEMKNKKGLLPPQEIQISSVLQLHV